MSILPKETIKVIGESIGLMNLSDEIAASMAPDIEYRLREIVQEALKFTRHSKRSKLSYEDINNSLRLRNVEPLYGYSTNNPQNFVRAVGTKDLFFLEDRELEFNEIINAPLPKCPRDTTLSAHWLAIEGVMPSIPQNPQTTEEELPLESKLSALPTTPQQTQLSPSGGLKVKVKPLVKHIISQELQVYYENITSVFKGNDQKLITDAIHSLTNDPGLHPLLPYLIQFVSDEVTHNLHNLTNLNTLMHLLQALLDNPYLHVDPYLHQMMPSLLTCLVGKKLCEKPTENHWSLRDYVAKLIGFICTRYKDAYKTLQPRVAKTLLQSLLDQTKPYTTHYGAIVGIAALGAEMIQVLLLPHIQGYYEKLQPDMASKDPARQSDALKCHSALLLAASIFVHNVSREYNQHEEVVANHTKTTSVDGTMAMQIDSKVQQKTFRGNPKVAKDWDILVEIFGDSIIPKQVSQVRDKLTLNV